MEKLKTFQDLEGHTIYAIEVKEDEILFTIENGDVYKLYHDQDCCETVKVEDVCGDPALMIGEKILMAYESSFSGEDNGRDDSYTWTFYILRTNSESLTIRFYGSSNGYYSEKVSWVKVKE